MSVLPQPLPDEEEGGINCGCHPKLPKTNGNKARNKLIFASILALTFMIGEVIGECEEEGWRAQ